MISIFYLHRAKYFCLHSLGKYFHSSVLTNIFVPGISLRDSAGSDERVARPRCDQAPGGDGSGARRDGSPESGDGAGATGGHSGYGDMIVYCAGH